MWRDEVGCGWLKTEVVYDTRGCKIVHHVVHYDARLEGREADAETVNKSLIRRQSRPRFKVPEGKTTVLKP